MTGQSIGRYEITEELGRGGMAVVYRARDPRFRRDVALKVLPRELLHDPQFRARFEREALAIATLEHWGIVPVYDFGEDDGHLFLSMRLMPGGSLADRLQGGSVSLAESTRIISRLAPALDFAHRQGVIHRDIKPGNILFDDQAMPYLTDFGIVKLLEDDSGLTGTGNLIGTPKYMSPEQALAGKALDGRSDIYALGVILYEMLTGKAPFEADTPLRTALMHINAPIPDIHARQAGLPRNVQLVIERALAKEPGQRYPTAEALAAALREMPDESAHMPSGPTVVVPALNETVVEPLPAPDASLPAPVAAHPAPAPRPTPTPQAGESPPVRRSAPWWVYVLLAILGVVLIIWALSNVVGGGLDSPEPTEAAQAAAAATGPAATAVSGIVLEATETDEPATATEELPVPTATDRPSATSTPTSAPTQTPDPNLPPADASLGDAWTRITDDMPMVYVPAGTFLMGSAADDPEAEEDEFPQHEVSLDAFWIDRTGVTGAQFEQFVEETGHVTTAEVVGRSFAWTGGALEEIDGADWQHPTGPGSDLSGLRLHPVLHLSWQDAEAYCAWAGGRLPTEAEWEYAARGPDGPRFPWGDSFDGQLANFCDANCGTDNADTRYDDGFVLTAPVGSYPAGASWVGALDMSGNVYNWVQDWYDSEYYDRSPADNPTGAANGSSRVVRGGSWHSRWGVLRAGSRSFIVPEGTSALVGFRCAFDPAA